MSTSVDYMARSAAYSHGIPPSWMIAVLNVENPGRDLNAVSYTGVQGLSQITHDTWASINGPNVPYNTDAAAQLDTQAKLLAKYQQKYGSDAKGLALSAAAYNGGPGVADKAQQLMQADSSLSAANAIAQALTLVTDKGLPISQKKQDETNHFVAKVTGQPAAVTGAGQPTGSEGQVTSPSSPHYLVNDAAAITALPVSGTALSSDQYASIYSAIKPLLIIKTNLYEQSWYDDKGITRQRRRNGLNPFPVTFQVFFESNYHSRLPLTIKLNASIVSYEKSMQHVISKQKTRTGLLVDFWGMQPDSITGEGSTGIMENQLGITDYISLIKPDDAALAAVRQGFSQLTAATTPLNPIATISTAASQADAQAAVAAAVRQGFTTTAVIRNGADAQVALSADSFRVAARDAFAEFLALFKNNASVWYRNDNYTGTTIGLTQTGPDAWSPFTGSSSSQNMARRNEVLTRGHVVMYFRNAGYSGYFKSLNWTMDAKTPFKWNFTFAFTVESTTLNIGLP